MYNPVCCISQQQVSGVRESNKRHGLRFHKRKGFMVNVDKKGGSFV